MIGCKSNESFVSNLFPPLDRKRKDFSCSKVVEKKYGINGFWMVAQLQCSSRTTRLRGPCVSSRERTVLVEPRTGDTVAALEHRSLEKKIGFCPLLPEDEYLGSWWERFFNTNAAAAFCGNINTVVVKSYSDWSAWWKGIILLHEGMHAHICDSTRNSSQRLTYCEEEACVHRFQNRIVSILGGRMYKVVPIV